MITAQASVTDSSALKFTSPGRVRATIYNAGTNTAFIGASGVAATTGLAIPSGGTVELVLEKGEAVHAVCASTETATLSAAFTPVQ